MSQTVKKLFNFIKKRKIKIFLVFLIVSVVLISLSSFALAQTENGEKASSDPSSPIFTVLAYIGYAILWIVGWILALCAKLLNATLDPALYRFMDEGIVQAGWTIVRDVCNLFFILILLVIAFATILRLETYDVKRMLPKLLIIALFINFSKMICGLIIDFSQILMNTFLDAMDGKHFSEFIANKTGLIENLYAELPPIGSLLTKGGNANLSIVSNMALAIIFFLILGIVFLIMGVLLLIRIIALWVLIILAPMAWLIGIIPTGKKFADQWWNYFIRYCFFGPIMAFFLYLSYKSMGEITKFTDSTGINELGFLTNTLRNFLIYVTIIILLIASVIVSKTLGIAGAGFLIGGAKKMAGLGIGAITRKPKMWTAQKARGMGVAAFGKTLGKIPGLQGVARRMKSAEAGRQMDEARKEYGKYYTSMSPTDLMESAEHDVGIKRAIAAEVALGRGLYGDAKPEKVESAKATFERFGQREQLRALEEQQPDIAKDTSEVIERMGIGGIMKLKASALTPKVIKALQAQLTTSQFAKIFKGWAKRTRDAAEESLQEQFSADFDDKDNINARKYFAKATDRPDEAFYMSKAGVYGAYKKKPKAEQEAKRYILSFKAKDFGNLRGPKDWQLAARYMSPGQVSAAGAELSEEQKEEMRKIAKKENTEAFDAMRKAETWGYYKP